MKFTKDEISLCKQIAEKHKKPIDYGDWYWHKIDEDVFLHSTKEAYPYVANVEHDYIIPLWTISDCLEFLETRKSWRVSFLNTSKNINTSTSGESLVCFNYWDEQEKVIVKRGKTLLEACLKAVLAVLEEESMKYKLNVSHNCGISYGVEKESDNLEELKKEGKKLDEQMLRWDIEDEAGKQVECSAVHKGIVNFMGAMRKREVEEVDWSGKKHELFESCEELIREGQERLLWWVESRNNAKGLMLWALKSSPKDFPGTFELLTETYREIEDCLRKLKKIRDLQSNLWRVETAVRINLSVDKKNNYIFSVCAACGEPRRTPIGTIAGRHLCIIQEEK